MKHKSKNNSKKKYGGADINVPAAAINLVTESIGLGESIFKAVYGIMSMPKDIAKAVPNQVQKNEPAQVKQPIPVKMPTDALERERIRVKGK